MRRAIFLPAKVPRPGHTKTRLTPALTPEGAAELYRALLMDCARLALDLAWERTAVCFQDEPGAGAAMRELLPAGVELRPRAERELGPLLAGSFRDFFDEGFERVLVIGSDNPSVPAAVVEGALRGLDEHDLAIGPTTDGGYYLLGMSRFHPELFEGISWSTDRVYKETLERAREAGLDVLAAREWHDVDVIADVNRLRSELAHVPASVARATRAALAELPC